MIEQVARIRIELRELEPMIWRRVDVPLSSTLEALHHIIQAAFRWQDYHLYEFNVGERVYGVPLDGDVFAQVGAFGSNRRVRRNFFGLRSH